jgi:hypothetical protein
MKTLRDIKLSCFPDMLIMIIIRALLKSYPQIKGFLQIIQEFFYMLFCSYPKTICVNHPGASPGEPCGINGSNSQRP